MVHHACIAMQYSIVIARCIYSVIYDAGRKLVEVI